MKKIATLTIDGLPVTLQTVAPCFDPALDILLIRYDVKDVPALIVCKVDQPELTGFERQVVEHARIIVASGGANAHLINKHVGIPDLPSYIGVLSKSAKTFPLRGDDGWMKHLGLYHSAPEVAQLIRKAHQHGWKICRFELAATGTISIDMSQGGTKRIVRISERPSKATFGEQYLDVSPTGMSMQAAINTLCPNG